MILGQLGIVLTSRTAHQEKLILTLVITGIQRLAFININLETFLTFLIVEKAVVVIYNFTGSTKGIAFKECHKILLVRTSSLHWCCAYISMIFNFNSFHHYFDCIIPPVPFRDLPLLHLVSCFIRSSDRHF